MAGEPRQEQPSKSAGMKSSTAKVLEKLTRLVHKLPAEMPQQDVAKIIIMDAQTARLRNIIKQSSRLYETVASVDHNIGILGQSKSTIPLQQVYYQQLVPLKADATERLNQREQLEQLVTQFIGEKNSKLAEMVKSLGQGNPSGATLSTQLESLDKRLQDLQAQTKKLRTNEVALQQKLDSLHREVFLTVPNADQSRGAQPSTPGLS